MRIWAAFAFTACATTVQADPFERLMTALQMDEVVEILAEEGAIAAADLEESMFPGRGGAAWDMQVAQIYDQEMRQIQLRQDMAAQLEGADLDPLVSFFESDRGERIITLEVSARRAFMDPDMEALALDAFADAPETRPELFERVGQFTEVNRLLEQNLEGAFRSNAAFALGAHEAGAFPGMTVDQLIAEMWSGDEALEAGISDWLYAYLMTAYSPLSTEDLDAYIALSATELGQQLNAAIMGAFDILFADISYDLGLAAGLFMAQQEL